MASVPERMTELKAAVETARSRVHEIDAAQRAAAQAVEEASSALAEFERHGGRAGERQRLEKALALAKEAKSAPWEERRLGAQAGLRDATGALQIFAQANLAQLLTVLEEAGTRAATSLDSAAEAVLAAFNERMDVERQTFATLALAGGSTRPGDVRRSRAEPLVNEARRFLGDGGEAAPDVIVRPEYATIEATA
jgi:hypothetical protein